MSFEGDGNCFPDTLKVTALVVKTHARTWYGIKEALVKTR